MPLPFKLETLNLYAIKVLWCVVLPVKTDSPRKLKKKRILGCWPCHVTPQQSSGVFCNLKVIAYLHEKLQLQSCISIAVTTTKAFTHHYIFIHRKCEKLVFLPYSMQIVFSVMTLLSRHWCTSSGNNLLMLCYRLFHDRNFVISLILHRF